MKRNIKNKIAVLAAATAIAGAAVLLNSTTAKAFEKGTGTAADPYEITNLDELREVKNDLSAHYKLMNDINLNDIWGLEPTDERILEPIGTKERPFTGYFDGQGYGVANYWVRNTDEYTGFFGAIEGAEIKNLCVNCTYVTSKESFDEPCKNVGGVIGYAENSKITNCHAIETALKGSGLIGGVVAEANNTEITESSFDGKLIQIKGNSSLIGVGGIAGKIESSTKITDCFSAGNIIGDNNLAGIVQFNDGNNTKVKNCYAAIRYTTSGGRVQKHASGVLAENKSVSENCYYNSEIARLAVECDDEMGRFTGIMLGKDTYKGWDFDNIWSIREGQTFPYLKTGDQLHEQTNIINTKIAGKGTVNEPYLIRNYDQLNLVNNDLNACYKLDRNININNFYGEKENFEKAFTPIGTLEKPFKGKFDGAGHSVSNFYIMNDNGNVGFFKALDGAEIKNLSLVNPVIYTNKTMNLATNDARAITCLTNNSIISECNVSGLVER